MTAQSLHYVPEVGAEDSVAILVDRVRGLLVEALDRGESVDELIVPLGTAELLREVKRRELDAGRTLTVLGLVVEAAGEERE